ncbi:type II toxin-antitoxin system PemK/MazF family toxin [Cellulomonas hominis]
MVSTRGAGWARPLRAAARLLGLSRGRTTDGPARRASAPTAPRDFTGPLRAEYAPHPDGRADPGEVVWTWVPYEEDPQRGKDRPVLVVGRDGPWLLALMLTSKDHDGTGGSDGPGGPAADRRWMDLGSGPWDARGRPSEVRLDRVLRVDPGRVRREGAVLDRQLFDQVVRASTAARGRGAR